MCINETSIIALLLFFVMIRTKL